MQPLATIPPVRFGDENASSELGAKVESTALKPWPVTQGGASAGLVLLFCGLVAAILATSLYLNHERTGAMGAGGIALPLLLAAVGAFRKRGEQRGTLTVYERGFTVAQRGKSTSAQWADVQWIALKDKEWLLNGKTRGLLRELRLALPSKTLVLANALRTGEDDAFGRSSGALYDALTRLASERIRTGGSLVGERWSVTLAGIRSPTGSTYAFSQLCGAGIWEGRVRFWVDGKDDPVLDLPAHGRNARLLLLAAAQELPDRSGQPASTTGFGRRLFTRKTSAHTLGLVGVGAALLGAIGASTLASDGQYEAAAALGAGAVLTAAFVWRALKARIFIHERGVKLRGLFGNRELLFADLSAFTYGAVRQYYNGAYAGTHHTLALVPAGKGKKQLRFVLTTRGTDDDLEHLRDSVAALVADRLHDELRANGQVAWAGAVLTGEGVRYRPTKLLGGKQPEQLLPYPLAAHSFQDGKMSLFGEDKKKPVFTLQAAGHNFYPGLQLYFRLCDEATRSARGGVVIV